MMRRMWVSRTWFVESGRESIIKIHVSEVIRAFEDKDLIKQ